MSIKFFSALLLATTLLVFLQVSETRVTVPQIEPRKSASGDVTYSPSASQPGLQPQENNDRGSSLSFWGRIFRSLLNLFKSSEQTHMDPIPVQEEDQNVNSASIRMIPIEDQKLIYKQFRRKN